MNKEEEIFEIFEILNRVGAVIFNSHVVYTSGKHGTIYINKDAVYPHTAETSRLCRMIAERFIYDDVKVVIAPAIGGVILSQWTAYHLAEMIGHDVFGIYAEKAEESVIKADKDSFVDIGLRSFALLKDEEIVIKRNNFIIKRGYDKFITGENVLVVEDVLTTGGSAKKVIEAVRAIGGKVVGLGVLCNRGGITLQDVANPPKLFSLVNVKLDAWDEEDCPLCKQNIPINTDVGKGREYLARKK